MRKVKAGGISKIYPRERSYKLPGTLSYSDVQLEACAWRTCESLARAVASNRWQLALWEDQRQGLFPASSDNANTVQLQCTPARGQETSKSQYSKKNYKKARMQQIFCHSGQNSSLWVGDSSNEGHFIHVQNIRPANAVVPYEIRSQRQMTQGAIGS